mgnify:CR=1 FL=1
MLQMRPGFRENIRPGCTATATGPGPMISNTISRFNSSSLYNDGTANYLLLQPTSSFAIGTSNFTLEFWYYPLAYSTQTFFGTRPQNGSGPYMSVSMYGTGNRGINFYVNNTQVILEENVFTTNTWTNEYDVNSLSISHRGIRCDRPFVDTVTNIMNRTADCTIDFKKIIPSSLCSFPLFPRSEQ